MDMLTLESRFYLLMIVGVSSHLFGFVGARGPEISVGMQIV